MPYTLERKIELRQRYVDRERARIAEELKQPDYDADAIARIETYLDAVQSAIDAAKADLNK